ncbi:MAG TPA: hypothetical protein VNF74_00020 [Terriglobales bacterium]|nr:hypothetical protein [Terriglobales bacterium]
MVGANRRATVAQELERAKAQPGGETALDHVQWRHPQQAALAVADDDHVQARPLPEMRPPSENKVRAQERTGPRHGGQQRIPFAGEGLELVAPAYYLDG